MLTDKDRRKKGRVTEQLRKVRIANLQVLAEHFGSGADLARRLGVTASYVTQLCGPTPTRGITEDTAREIEEKLGLKSGWMDIPQ
jgi:plasmid maintenance system antidote protein VapI